MGKIARNIDLHEHLGYFMKLKRSEEEVLKYYTLSIKQKKYWIENESFTQYPKYVQCEIDLLEWLFDFEEGQEDENI